MVLRLLQVFRVIKERRVLQVQVLTVVHKVELVCVVLKEHRDRQVLMETVVHKVQLDCKVLKVLRVR